MDPESGEALSPIDYHEPGPLFYEMRADVETFGADRNTVDHRGPEEYVATLLGQ